MKLKIFFLFVTLSLFSCSQTKKEYKLNYYGGHLYFDIIFNSKKGNENFIFDTGSSDLYIDSIYYKNNPFLNNKKAVKGKISGAGEDKKIVNVIIDSINFQIGKQDLYSSKITPIIDIKNIVGKRGDGIFGLNFFTNKKIQLDYKNEKMILYDTINNSVLKHYQKIPLIIIDNRFFIEIEIKLDSSKIKGLFMIDTGYPGTLTINSGIVNPKQKTKKSNYISGGIGGESKGLTTNSNSIKIQNFIFKNTIIDISIDESGALANPKYVGTIGNELLDKFDIIFDRQNSALYLKEIQNLDKNFNKNTLGFSIIDRTDIHKGWIVTSIYLNSKAAINGLKIKDQIIKINGIPVEKLGDDILWKKEIIDTKVNLNLEILRNNKNYYIKSSVEYLPSIFK